ncbi:hypothetical protein BX667DRAFT_508330 [Coemansia mojavensis]|nr:hypothetical protein BX667DRAFT_508330 [Coemansia mojavensis]
MSTPAIISTAQRLPYNIIEDIGKCVLPTPHCFGSEGRALSAKLTLSTEFIVLMSLCRSWRQALLSRFLKTALLRLVDDRSTTCWMLPSIHNIDNQYCPHVKELVVAVDISTFLITGNQPISSKLDLTSIPPFGSVRSIIVNLILNDNALSTARHNILPDDLEQSISQSLRSLTNSIHRIAPNAKGLFMAKSVPARLSATSMAINNMVDEVAPVFIQKQIVWLYLHRFSTRPLLNMNTMPTGLNSLVLQCTLSTNLDYELVIRNSNTLEHLQITCLQESYVSTLVYSAEYPKCTRVYPQLRRLVIDSHLSQAISLPQTNPFPKLKTLICRGTFPFSSPHIFYSGLSQFCHLDIDMHLDLMNMFMANKILDKHAFKNLYYLRLGWAKPNQHNFTKERAKALIKAAIELSSKTRALNLYNSYGPDIGNVFESAELPTYLKQLHMPAIPLSIHNLVNLFDKLKNLENATACVFCGLECSESIGPSQEHIQEFQQLYKQNNASVYNLCVKAAGYEHFRKVAETMVLLADILPNIYRMSIYPNSKTSTSQHQYIEQAKTQAVYEGNTRLANVKFSVLLEWLF